MTIEFREPRIAEEPALRRLWEQAFGEEGAFVDLFFETAYSPERCRVAADGGIAAMLYWFDCCLSGRKVAYIYAVAVEKAYRNRGVGAGLLQDTHRHLEKLGYAGAMLVPGEPGLFGYYEKQGYRTCSAIREFRPLPDGAVPFRQIAGTEYAALRRDYLPENGVIQEGESLTLLEKLAAFYAGDGFLAAVGGIGEWLGDEAAAPGLLGALGLPAATFRTPGPGRPFAMARWFRPDFAPEKVYFSFAFD